jgi:hypothetical protein
MKSPAPRREDRGRAASVCRFVDYARARRRPSVSRAEKPVVIDMRMYIRVCCIPTAPMLFAFSPPENKKARRAARLSRFSNYLTWLQ